MVLRLKARKSRSPPDLQKSKTSSQSQKTNKPPKRRFCCFRGKLSPRQNTGSPERASWDRKIPEAKQTYDAGWSSPVARQAHNLKAAGSNPAPATKIITRYHQHAPRQTAGLLHVQTEQHILQRFQTLTNAPDFSLQHSCETGSGRGRQELAPTN